MSKKPQQKPVKPAGSPSPQTTAAAGKAAVTPQTKGKGLSLVAKLSIVLALVCFVLYANTLKNGYVLDDIIMVKENTIVAKGFAGIGELLATPHMRGYLVIPNDTYRPLSLVMFAMETQFAPGNPAVNHFFNIVTFALCVLLLFSFLDKLFDNRNPLAAFVGAMIFAIHPVHTEVVANIKSRDEILCFLFAFWALNVFLKYMREGKTMQLLGGTFLMYLSIISKENAITFLGVVPLLFYFVRNDNKERALRITLGTVAAMVAFIAVRHFVLAAYDANKSSDIEFIDNALVNAPNFAVRIATAVFISGKYLWLLFIPHPLICNYSFNAIPFRNFADIGVIVSAAAYLGMIYVAITRMKKDKRDPLAFAILFYLMTISLFNNLFILIGAEMGERFMFMASAGLCIAATFAVDKWILPAGSFDLAALKNPKILAIIVPLTLLFGGMVYARNQDWIDNVQLYKVDLAKSPEDARLNYYLGTALAETEYAQERDPAKRKAIDEEAIVHLRKSLAIYPNFAEANAEMGRVFDREQRYDSAEIYDRKALALNPGHVVATNNLGSVYLASGKYRKAIETFDMALKINPDFHLAYFNKARTYNQLKIYDSAIYNFRKELLYSPGNVDAYQEMGMAFFCLTKYDSAEFYFKKVIALIPEESNAINNLGAIYLNTKNYPKAIEQFQKSIKIKPDYMNAYSNLGRAFYFNKQYQDAINTFTKEISLNNKEFRNIPYIALSYQGMGNMEEARKYEAIAKHYYADFKLN